MDKAVCTGGSRIRSECCGLGEASRRVGESELVNIRVGEYTI